MKDPKQVALCSMAAAFRTGGIHVGMEVLNFLIASPDARESYVFVFIF